MYANYMTHGPPKRTSILRFTPPGLSYPIDIPFPGRVLPVCARCKKNYKTREHCRSKEGHNGLPWTDTYICITLDNTCFAADGSILNGTFHAQGVQSNPYVYPDHVNLDPKTPSCAQCKDKNYTRTYCRMSKKHKTLPWSTVYVTLTLARNVDGSPALPLGIGNTGASMTISMGASTSSGAGAGAGAEEKMAKKIKKNDGEAAPADASAGATATEENPPKKEEAEGKDGDLKRKNPSSDDAPAAETAEKKEGASAGGAEKKEDEEEHKPAEIFHNPHPSRTFLSTVSVLKNEAKWVDLDQGAAALMQHRAPKQDGSGLDGSDVPPHMYTPHSPYQMMPNGMHGAMGMGMGMHPMGYPGMPPVPGGAPGSGVKDDPSRPSPGQDNQHHQWGMNAHGGMPGPGQYPTPEMMYNAAQMMDPRMGGYGFQPSWPGRGGYPMDMQQMQGGPPGQMGQMPSPYDGHMMQQMPPTTGWGGGHPGMGQQGGGQGDMPQSMPPGSSPAGNGMQMPGQGMMPQSVSQGMSRQMYQGMPEGNVNAMEGGAHDLKGDGSGPMMGGPDPSHAKDEPKENGSSETLQI